jgi:hypothetical protein
MPEGRQDTTTTENLHPQVMAQVRQENGLLGPSERAFEQMECH